LFAHPSSISNAQPLPPRASKRGDSHGRHFGYRKDCVKTFVLLLITAALGASFVGMQLPSDDAAFAIAFFQSLSARKLLEFYGFWRLFRPRYRVVDGSPDLGVAQRRVPASGRHPPALPVPH
jgi:hypothetical protein